MQLKRHYAPIQDRWYAQSSVTLSSSIEAPTFKLPNTTGLAGGHRGCHWPLLTSLHLRQAVLVDSPLRSTRP